MANCPQMTPESAAPVRWGGRMVFFLAIRWAPMYPDARSLRHFGEFSQAWQCWFSLPGVKLGHRGAAMDTISVAVVKEIAERLIALADEVQADAGTVPTAQEALTAFMAEVQDVIATQSHQARR